MVFAFECKVENMDMLVWRLFPAEYQVFIQKLIADNTSYSTFTRLLVQAARVTSHQDRASELISLFAAELQPCHGRLRESTQTD